MSDCLFCKIAAGEIPSTCLYDDDDVYAFRDINPQMPVHFLVIPKQHIDAVASITADNSAVVAKCISEKLLHLCLKILHIRACPIQDMPDRGLSDLLAFLTDQSHQPDCQRLLILTRHLYHAPFILHCFV